MYRPTRIPSMTSLLLPRRAILGSWDLGEHGGVESRLKKSQPIPSLSPPSHARRRLFSSLPSPLRQEAFLEPSSRQPQSSLGSVTPQNSSPLNPTSTEAIPASCLALLSKDTNLYAIAEIRGRPYHVHKNDVVVLDRANDLRVGDVIRLDTVTEVGGDNYVLQGKPFVQNDWIDIQCVCLEHTTGQPMLIKKQRRRGQRKVVINEQHVTLLRVSKLVVKA
ncbi:hypothetical protein M427DRAFT_63033 [Gonapodya prolifera JEL478]|uniref:Large ribosomal subunit protein bL21m n=1 Tax=Gonapodya prolifera (strain JEL478) TaxID=1344416 RepID=A0A139A008_GONPJ|nr:hypothetical protein M427DRAFT_63033 [Gonapodya prolifera JEL478]|eukprot:KXS10100.1 hypothetical protein M427DRAFT_63033 [Gonapodya prolifera JEL478]